MNEKLVLINKNTLESLAEVDVVKIIEKFTKTAVEVLEADFGFMFWKQETQNAYQVIYTTPETPYKPKLPRKRGYNYKARLGRIPYFVTSPKRDLLPYMKSLAIVPIFHKDHEYGNIVICFNKKRIFDEKEKPLIMTLANSTAHVLTIFKDHKKTERNSEKLLKQKDEFFNIVSHELKTPITTIKGYSEILAENLKNTSKETKYFFEKINTQVDKLIYIINDLLDVSRIEKGKLKFKLESIDLQKLVSHVVEGLRVAITTHPILFSSNAHFWVHADCERLEGVLINLITNAAKYSNPGTKIRITIKEKKGNVEVRIEDYGYGISEKDHSKVFSRFFQSSESRKKNIPGLGLGLFIAKSIIKQLNGTLDFISKKSGDGSIFYFSLPYHKVTKK